MASTPAPLRGLVVVARSAQVGSLNAILLVGALASLAAAVASFLLVRERDFVETSTESREEAAQLAAVA